MRYLWYVEYHGKRGLAFHKGGLWYEWISQLLFPDQQAVRVIPFTREESM